MRRTAVSGWHFNFWPHSIFFWVFTVFASIVKILADSFYKRHFGGRKTGNSDSEVNRRRVPGSWCLTVFSCQVK